MRIAVKFRKPFQLSLTTPQLNRRSSLECTNSFRLRKALGNVVNKEASVSFDPTLHAATCNTRCYIPQCGTHANPQWQFPVSSLSLSLFLTFYALQSTTAPIPLGLQSMVHPHPSRTLLLLIKCCLHVQGKIILRLTISRPVCPGISPPCGTSGQYLFLPKDSIFGHLRVLFWYEPPSLTRGWVCSLLLQVLLGLASAVILE
jgi:hypothetical protein